MSGSPEQTFEFTQGCLKLKKSGVKRFEEGHKFGIVTDPTLHRHNWIMNILN